MHRPDCTMPFIVLAMCMAGLGAAEPAAAAADPDRLLADLPHVPEIARHGDQVTWAAEAVSVRVTGVDKDAVLIDSAIGALRVQRQLIEQRRLAVLLKLPALVEQAKAAGVAGGELLLQHGILTGPSLRSPGTVVTAQGVLRKQPDAASDRKAEIARIGSAVQALQRALPDTGLDAIAQRALDDTLQHLERPDGHQAIDELRPSFARRVVRHGWLRQWFRNPTGQAAATAVEQAVDAAERPAPVTRFTGGSLRLEELRDAFGRGGWVWHRGDRVIYAQPEPEPEMLGRMPTLTAVVELHAAADPAADAGKALAARCFAGLEEVATWTASGGFVSDAQRWRSAAPARGGDLVEGAIPPHIVIADLHGDIAGLAVGKGLLHPPADGGAAETDRFLAEAGKLLPDAAHLDLIGEYLFSYIYPSPDAKHPLLMGNKQIKSNVQQTVRQTCGNVSGGIMHGDCADIAELYHTITAAQGRNPIVIGLPEHAACAWAEQKEGRWQVFVLQTGPPLAFSDAQLPDCLGKAYKSFDPGMAFDANQVPLLLRFSGEVSRSSWQLSWRIFSDPAYAATMIDVQRDWHFQTYQRGIATMQKLIAGGDHDNANYRELAGLSTFTGQYEQAAGFHRQAMELTEGDANRLGMSIELVGMLLNAKKADQAKALAEDVLAKQLPPLKAQLGDAMPRLCLQLASACLNVEGGPGLRQVAQRVLNETVRTQFEQAIEQMSRWIASPKFNRSAWENDPGLRSLRGQLAEYTGLIIGMLDADGTAQLPGDANTRALAAAVQRWLDGIAFTDVEEDSAVMGRYAAAGSWYGTVFGEAEFDRMLDGAALPTETRNDHAQRVGGAWQAQRDLPWIRASVPYWHGRIIKLFRRDRTTIDAKAMARLATRLEEARAATARLGLADPWSENEALLGAEIAALIAHDEAGLRRALHRVAEANAKELRDDAAQWLGDAARFLPTDWYGRVLQAWVDEVDYKPKYFWIAWRAALTDAPEQALMAAKLAATRFKDDPAFTEEYGFMRTLLEPRLVPAKAVRQPAGVTP